MSEIIIGVTGGIAAYKSADLVSKLSQRGMQVTVVMTDAACRFVSPPTFAALSGGPWHRNSSVRPIRWAPTSKLPASGIAMCGSSIGQFPGAGSKRAGS